METKLRTTKTRYYLSIDSNIFYSVTKGVLYAWDYKNSNTFVRDNNFTKAKEKARLEMGEWEQLNKRNFISLQE